MKMKRTLVTLLCVFILTIGYFKGHCANEEANQTSAKKTWELGTRFSTSPEQYLKWYNALEEKVKENERKGKPLDDVLIEFKKLIDTEFKGH